MTYAIFTLRLLSKGHKHMLYSAWSRWGTYRGCCSRRNGARISG